MFMVRIKEKGGEDRMLPFEKEEVSIGRGKGNDIILPKGNVSKRHARIVHRDGKFIVVDLRSTNGTYFNARKISSPVIVTPQDKIYIGDFVLRVLPGGVEDAHAYESEPAIQISPPDAPPIPGYEAPGQEPEIDVPFAFEETPAPEIAPAEPTFEPEAVPEPVIETPTEDEEAFEETRGFDISEIQGPEPVGPRDTAIPEAPEAPEWGEAEEAEPELEIPIDFEEPSAPAYAAPLDEPADEPVGAADEAIEETEFGEPEWEEPSAPAPTPSLATYEADQEPEEALPVSPAVEGEGLLLALARETDVQEVAALGPQSIFVTREGVRSRFDGGYADDGAWRRDLDSIIRRLGADPDAAPPFLEGVVEQELRVRVLSPPLATGGPVCQVNRALGRGVTMATLEERGVIDADAADLLADAVRGGRSVLVVGPPRSGRSTLLNALGHFLSESALIVVAEERPELRIPHPGVIRIQLGETGEDEARTLRQLRRLGADAVVVGSLPARMLPTFVEMAHEAATLVLAAVTGRNLDRFVQHAVALCNSAGGELAGAAPILADALDVLVQMERVEGGGCRVGRIAALEEGPDGRLGLSNWYGA